MRMLVAYSMTSMETQTIIDYATSFSRYLPWDVDYVHATNAAVMGFDFSAYDVLFHNYCVRLPVEGYASESYKAATRAFGGLKILSIQDEYDRTDLARAAIRDLGFHVVLTCVPAESIEKIYPAADFPGVQFKTVLTGYVPDDLACAAPASPPLGERQIAIGYRTRDLGGRYGQLAFDKFEIGRRMREICQSRGLAVDISWDEADRLYGKAWLGFLGQCRATLGAESGSNVFDDDGSLAAQFRAETAALGRPPSYEEWLPRTAAREREISMGQISPRVFEAAAMRTPMILFEGRYSDVARPDVHYIPLAKDFSNVEAVLTRLDDIEALDAMAGRAHAELVASGRYGYRAFVLEIVDLAAAEITARGLPRASGASRGQRPPPPASPLTELPTPEPKRRIHFDYRQALEANIALRAQLDAHAPELNRLRRIIAAEKPLAGTLLAARSLVGSAWRTLVGSR